MSKIIPKIERHYERTVHFHHPTVYNNMKIINLIQFESFILRFTAADTTRIKPGSIRNIDRGKYRLSDFI